MKQEEERLSFRRGDAVAMIGVVLAALVLLVVFLRFPAPVPAQRFASIGRGKRFRS